MTGQHVTGNPSLLLAQLAALPTSSGMPTMTTTYSSSDALETRFRFARTISLSTPPQRWGTELLI